MRYTKVSLLNDLPISTNNPPPTIDGSNAPGAPEDESKIKFMYYPRIRCKDCPGKMYTPGPETGVNNFEVHLKIRLHRDKVEKRVAAEAASANLASQVEGETS